MSVSSLADASPFFFLLGGGSRRDCLGTTAKCTTNAGWRPVGPGGRLRLGFSGCRHRGSGRYNSPRGFQVGKPVVELGVG